MKRLSVVSLAMGLLVLCGCTGGGIMDTYWRDDKTGEWLIGLTEEKLIYDCKIWDIASMNKSNGTYSIKAKCGVDSLDVCFGKGNGGRRTVSIGDKQFDCSLIDGRHLPDYPQKDTCTALADNHYAEGDIVTVVGWVKPRTGLFALAKNETDGKEVTVLMMANIFSGEVPGFTVPIDSLGRFTLRIPIENTTCFTLTIQDRILAEIVAEPNETYFLMKDYARGKTLLMGKRARLQNELRAHRIEIPPYGITELTEIGDIDSILVSIKNNTKLTLQKLDEVCREHPTLSERYRIFIRNRILAQNAYSLMQGWRLQPNRGLLEEYIRTVDEEYLKEFDEPYSMASYEFSHFLGDYRIFLMEKAQNEHLIPTKDIMESAERAGLFKLTAKDREAIRRYDEASSVWWEQRQNVPDSLQKVIDEEFGKNDFVAAVLEIQARNPKFRDYNLQALDKHIAEQMKKEMGARGLSETLQDIILSYHLCSGINSRRIPLSEDFVAFADECLHIPAARSAVHTVNDRYLQIGQKRVLSREDNLKSNDVVKDMSDGEEIFRKLIEPYKGKIILVDFWGTWCSPCRERLKHSQEEYERLKDFDIVYLYLASRSSDEAWKNAIEEYKVEGDNVVHYNLPARQQTAVENYFGVRVFPTYRLIDRDGTILDVNADPGDLETLAGLLERMK